jgi:hypothetical protein
LYLLNVDYDTASIFFGYSIMVVERDLAVLGKRLIVLSDLISIWLVPVKVMLAIKRAFFGDLTIEGKRGS